MKLIKQSGLVIFLIGLAFFIGTIFTGSFSLTPQELDTFIIEKGYKSEVIKDELSKAIVNKENLNIFTFSSKVITAFETSNKHYDALIAKYNTEKNWTKKGQQYQYKISGKLRSKSFILAKKQGKVSLQITQL